jgi:hypothetical protein
MVYFEMNLKFKDSAIAEEEVLEIVFAQAYASNLRDELSMKHILDCETIEDLSEYFVDAINDSCIIGFGESIEYLSEKDCSLMTSMSLAESANCSMRNLCSETLATLLYQHYLRDEAKNVLKKIYEKLTDNLS